MYYEKEEDCPACNAQLTNYDGQYCGKCGASYWNHWTPTTMSVSTLLDKAIQDALRNLNAAGCKYVIQKADGTVINGGLEIAPVKAARKKEQRPRTNFAQSGYMEVLKAAKVGEVLELPYGDFVPEDYRSTISASASRHFGNGNAMTTVNHEKRCVELLRLG